MWQAGGSDETRGARTMADPDPDPDRRPRGRDGDGASGRACPRPTPSRRPGRPPRRGTGEVGQPACPAPPPGAVRIGHHQHPDVAGRVQDAQLHQQRPRDGTGHRRGTDDPDRSRPQVHGHGDVVHRAGRRRALGVLHAEPSIPPCRCPPAAGSGRRPGVPTAGCRAAGPRRRPRPDRARRPGVAAVSVDRASRTAARAVDSASACVTSARRRRPPAVHPLAECARDERHGGERREQQEHRRVRNQASADADGGRHQRGDPRHAAAAGGAARVGSSIGRAGIDAPRPDPRMDGQRAGQRR